MHYEKEIGETGRGTLLHFVRPNTYLIPIAVSTLSPLTTVLVVSLIAKEIVRAVTAGSKVLHVTKDEKVWPPLWLTFKEPKLTVVVDAQREGVTVKEIWLVYDCWARAKAKLPRRIRQDSAKVFFFMAP
jgi:hypothetical protein